MSMILPLASLFGFFQGVVEFLFFLVCVVLILLVLIQKGRGGGLVSAFGGMGGNTAFGSKTGDVLTWATSIIFGVFLLLAVILNLMSGRTAAPASAGATTPPARSTPAAPTTPTTPAPAPQAP